SGTFSWTPTLGQAGNYTLTFTATNALSGSAATLVTVGPDERSPTVTAPATASGNENTLITFTVTAADPRGFAITSFTASSTPPPAGSPFPANASKTSGTFSWTPTFTQAGTYTVTFTASNDLSASASTTITVNNVDRAPVVTAPVTATFFPGIAGTITVAAADP